MVETVKNWILKSIVALTSVLMLLTPAFMLTYFKLSIKLEQIPDFSFGENGYNYVQFSGTLVDSATELTQRWITTFIGVFSILLLVLGVIFLVNNILILMGVQERTKGFTGASFALSGIFSVVYLVFGIIVTSKINAGLANLYNFGYDIEDFYNLDLDDFFYTAKFVTASFWPLIIFVVLLVLYLVFKGIQGKEKTVKAKVQTAEEMTKADDTESGNNDIEMLEKINQLYEKGILSQEEFTLKKKELLGL